MNKDVLEQNVETLIETGGEPPRISDAARTRIRAELVHEFGVVAARRSQVRVRAIALGLAATVAAVMLIGRLIGHPPAKPASTTLADGSTYIAQRGAKVAILGPRHVRVDGAVLLDVAPGKGTFVVDTAHGRIEVLGTRFLVEGSAERTLTAVVRGEVKLVSERKFAPGRALLTGGLSMSKTKEREVERRSDTTEPVLYVFRRRGAPWLLGQYHANYSALGASLQPTAIANFAATVERLRALAPTAFSDDRLLQRRTTTDDLDLLAHILAHAHAAAW